jgi:hypothetical protein
VAGCRLRCHGREGASRRQLTVLFVAMTVKKVMR